MKQALTLLVLQVLYTANFYSCYVEGEQISSSVVDGSAQVEAVEGLLRRLIPERAHEFIIQIDFSLGIPDKSTFQIENTNGTVVITGNKGYAAASGLHHYLKYYCGCHISWSGNQLNLPDTLPRLYSPVTRTSNDKYHYYMNVCTFSYTTVWWQWQRWEKEIDWMALNGINLPLAFTGQELIYKKVFKNLNFTDHEINEFFTGPAFLAWNRMGNVQGWAGPLSDEWLSQQAQLQHLILQRMRSFGMIPVLPAFSGRIPPSTLKYFPNASVTYLGNKWGHFNQPFTPVMFLQPTDPLFSKIAAMFLKEYIKEFSTDHVYNIDLFNEMAPSSNETSYLRDCGSIVYQTLISADPEAIWLLQGWMFFSDIDYWTPSRAKAFLTSVPIGKMIVLDLQAEMYPQYERLQSYYGQPFIWCMLHNYGGVLGLYGSLESVNTGLFEGRNYNGSTMIGTGITPEGIENNDVAYELMNDMIWRKSPVQLKRWLSRFLSRRYGAKSRDVNKAWFFLARSVYNATAPYRNHGKYILIKRPALNLQPYLWYDPNDVLRAWKNYIKASRNQELVNSQLFRHDLVDVTRQGLQIMMDFLYPVMKTSFRKKKIDDFRNISASILSLYDDLEELLSSDVHFLLGSWLDSARKLANTPLEKKQYDYNSRNQITLWGPSGQILDYANKQWAGMISGYYRKRWLHFLQTLETCLSDSTPFKQSKFNEAVLEGVEMPFNLEDHFYPTQPQGSPVAISRRLYQKYSQMIFFRPVHQEDNFTYEIGNS